MNRFLLNIKLIFQICAHRFFNAKFGVLVGINFFLFQVFLEPIKQIAITSGNHISLWGVPFIMANVYFLFMYLAGIVYFFSDVPFISRKYVYQRVRMGKMKWGILQLITIAICSVLIMVVTIINSILALVPHLQLEKSWGKIYYTVSLTNISTQYDVPFTIPYWVLNQYSPKDALVVFFITGFLVLTFLGTMMYCVSVWTSNTIAIYVGCIGSAMPLIIDNLSQTNPILSYFSPTSWMRVTRIGIEYSDIWPSFKFIAIVLIVGILGLGSASMVKVGKMDFDWINIK